MSLENLAWPYYRELKFLQKYKSSFVEVIWKSALPLLSRAEIFAKKKQFSWCDLKIETASIITSWNFLRNKAVLQMCFEN